MFLFTRNIGKNFLAIITHSPCWKFIQNHSKQSFDVSLNIKDFMQRRHRVLLSKALLVDEKCLPGTSKRISVTKGLVTKNNFLGDVWHNQQLSYLLAILQVLAILQAFSDWMQCLWKNVISSLISSVWTRTDFSKQCPTTV